MIIAFKSHYFCIYIPIWLDLLYNIKNAIKIKKKYLHSNMVRFIIRRLPCRV